MTTSTTTPIWYGAAAIRMGTNEQMECRAATAQELHLQLYGGGGGAKPDSVFYFRCVAPKEDA